MNIIPLEFMPFMSSAILIAVFIIIRFILRRIVKKYARKFERVEHRTGLILRYIDFFAIFGAILGLIVIWGVRIQDLGWVISSVFAVIGIGFFAQWSILSNITSGVIMFFTFPYKIGDYIIIHDKEFNYEGYIENIKAFQVVLKTLDNNIIVYPNVMLMQKGVSIIDFDDIPKISEVRKEDASEEDMMY